MLDLILWLTPILAVPGAAAVLAAILPQPTDDSRWEPLRKLLDVLAMNWMNARNAKQAPAVPAVPAVPNTPTDWPGTPRDPRD